MAAEKRIRVLMAKMGLDAHDGGIVIVSSFLRDAGMEVVYGGIFNTPETIMTTAEQENVDLIGLSFLTREHLSNVRRLQELLKSRGLDIPVVVGGIVPRADVPKLESMGVKKVFVPGTPREELVNSIREIVAGN